MPLLNLSLGLALVLLSISLALPAAGAPPERLGDLATEGYPPEWVGSAARPMAAFGADLGQMLVAAEDWHHGQELWVSDGTADGTRLVVDVNPDWYEECLLSPCPPIRSLPDLLTPFGDGVVFAAQPPGAAAPALWTSDGTAAGTHRVAGAAGLAIGTGMAALYGKVVLIATAAGQGPQLWVTDGTHAGTRRLTDLPAGRTPVQVVAGGGGALFTVRDTSFHDTLWRTDGTPNGTVEISTLDPAGFPEPPAGTSAGSLIRLLVPAGAPGQPAAAVYLVVDNAVLGRELWWSDGTSAGTGPIADLRPGPRGSNPAPLTTAGGRLLFAASGDAAGYELWITDGTGVERLTDLDPGPAASNPSAAVALGQRLVLAADDGEHGTEPWALDLPDAGGPVTLPPEGAPALISPDLPGFRVWVRITAAGAPGSQPILGTVSTPCIPETLCVAGSLPDRAEVFVRVAGPKPNGRLWPTLVKFTTSTVEVWIEQIRTGEVRYYRLDGARPGFDELPGLFDRDGFEPPA